MVIDLEKVQTDFLKKIGELTGINFCLTFKQMAQFETKLPNERIISRVLVADLGTNKFDFGLVTDDGSLVTATQVNINTLTLTFNCLCEVQKIIAAHHFFDHLKGSEWWAMKEENGYVIESVEPIIDLSDFTNSDYREKCSFDIIVRVKDEYVATDNLIKNVEIEYEGG